MIHETEISLTLFGPNGMLWTGRTDHSRDCPIENCRDLCIPASFYRKEGRHEKRH